MVTNDSPEHCRGQVIAFVSAKGGSGKTLLTATAAYLLARAGKKVLSIDTDFSTRGLSLYLVGGETAKTGRLEVQPENCLSEAFIDELPPQKIRPRVITRGGLDFDIVLSSMKSWISDKPDDRILYAINQGGSELDRRYFSYLRDLLNYFRSVYDYVLIDTRGGYDSSSASPAALADNYVIVLEADSISVSQVVQLKAGIEECGERNGIQPALGGFIVNKATFSGDSQLFNDSLTNLYGGSHFGTIPLDFEAVRAYQVRELPTILRPDSDFAFHSFASLERLFSPTLNWDKEHAENLARLGSQLRTFWKARVLWQTVERALPALVLLLALVTTASYIYLRQSEASIGITIFYFAAATFAFISTVVSAFVLLKNFQLWRIRRVFRIGIAAYGFLAAVALFWVAFSDVQQTLSKDELLARLESQDQRIVKMADELLGARRDLERSIQQARFASIDSRRQVDELKRQIAGLNERVTVQDTVTKYVREQVLICARAFGRSEKISAEVGDAFDEAVRRGYLGVQAAKEAGFFLASDKSKGLAKQQYSRYIKCVNDRVSDAK